MLNLKSGDVELSVDPWLGGGIVAFRWRGIDVFRPYSGGGSPIDLASFPMVPFCNRIAHGHIDHRGKGRMLPIAPDGIEPAHALHGIGWTSPWAIEHSGADHAALCLKHDGTLWPWEFETEQRFQLLHNGYVHTMSVTNRDQLPMPAGLGLHPYFPRPNATLELGAMGVWEIGEDRLPSAFRKLEDAPDWLASPGYDNCFVGCSNPFSIRWPKHRLTIHSSKSLPFVHVYTPPGEEFFCIEPVSHIPDAVNSGLDRSATGLTMLEPGQRMEIECRFELEELG